ncbi:MAG: U32 family peptidase [Sneathiella sp.]
MTLPIRPHPIKSELLMPAGSLHKLKLAILYGADAVYLGTPDMSLRTKSAFTLDDVIEGVEYAHSFGKRVYLTLNLFSHNKDIEKLPFYLETVRKVKPDGVIIADPGIFGFVKEMAPDLELHISTQANICSWLSVDFWKKQGASLCVMAREVSFPELAEIREKCPDIKLETFVHGAMCMTYSGRCLLSNYMAERGANQGNCANSCRWNYKVHVRLKDGRSEEVTITDENRDMFEFLLEEGERPNEFLPIEEDERGSYILNSKDLCIMPRLDDYLKIGVDSLKVEGRGKSPYYVALVARAYRMAIDDWYADPDNWSPKAYMDELHTVPNRGYTYAFHEGRLTHHAHNYEDTRTLAEWEYAGLIKSVEEDAILVEVKNTVEAGDVLEFVPHVGRDTLLLRIYEFDLPEKNKVTTIVHGGQKPLIRIPFALFDREDTAHLRTILRPLTIIRKEKPMLPEEWSRIKLDLEAQKIELGKGSDARYETKLENLQKALDAGKSTRKSKTPRIGTEGCCGKGCNGCMIFWNDPTYAKARDLLAQKKQGEMFEKDMRELSE